MNISQFSADTGLSAHTLRYYEKIGLLAPVYRNQSGHRDYAKKDLEWIAFIIRLKETAMPLKQILHYAHLREEGSETASERQALLVLHSEMLEARITTELEHLEALKKKIKYYDNHV
ncbi:MerR family transcriptional regulator [Moritella sp. Urea-trap-13]|uniref:MerR family transcriptional regulator n=1 Tax=Moritella sp. Urea-trap-13 TaxID=2058327 RepID=UPI000C3268E4|nr:MerR family transcriptional regulator [Moritella sp. Urea-trap-13]PKH06900.1 MerR family transcriptional regulator [Moritella sp. Urea-trap-13]